MKRVLKDQLIRMAAGALGLAAVACTGGSSEPPTATPAEQDESAGGEGHCGGEQGGEHHCATGPDGEHACGAKIHGGEEPDAAEDEDGHSHDHSAEGPSAR